MAGLSFRGEPFVVDIVLRPVLAGTRWVVGVGTGALLWWIDLIYWVPVPLLVATALMEGWLALRSDRPIRIELRDGKLVVDDRFAPTLTVFRDRVRALTIAHQPRTDAGRPGHEVVVVLASEHQVLLAVAQQSPELPGLPPHAVDVAAHDRRLGAQAGLLRAMAPVPRTCRQRVHDASFVSAIASWAGEVPCRAIRVWSGPQPPMSPFGLLTAEPLGVVLLGPEGWSLASDEGPTRQGPRRCEGTEVAEREAVLFGVDGQEDARAGVLPLLVLTLPAHDGPPLRIAVPAPALGGLALPGVDRDVVHTHAPEGAVLMDWLDGADALPDPLVEPPRGDREPSTDPGDTPNPSPGDATQ